MPYQYIRKNAEFETLCRKLGTARRIAVDTEFVAENSYLPQLCLIQLSLDDQLLVVDPLAVEGIQRFWEALAETEAEVILHAGRGELEFCYRAVRKFPRRIFDVQIAAGMTGHEYPAGYANLVSKLLDEKAGRHETRTDWRRRPLTDRQIEYALDDVRYLPRMRDVLHVKLVEWNREAWLQEEIERRNAEIVEHYRGTDRWRISGNRSLSRRGLAIVRELWKWREDRAARLNRPPRTILRDDLIVELAKRESADPKHILAVRGLGYPRFRKLVPEISEAVTKALNLPDDECPKPQFRMHAPHLPLLVQFLYAALGSVCRRAGVSPGLVGSPNDVRNWLGFRLHEFDDRGPPLLATGWRAELVGNLFDRLLSGREAIRIVDPLADDPFILFPVDMPAEKGKTAGHNNRGHRGARRDVQDSLDESEQG